MKMKFVRGLVAPLLMVLSACSQSGAVELPPLPTATTAAANAPATLQPIATVSAGAYAIPQSTSLSPTSKPITSDELSIENGALKQIGRGVLQQVKLTRDNKRLIVATSLGAELLDAQTLKKNSQIKSSVGVLAMAISADGKWLALGDQIDRISLFDLATGSVIRTFKGQADIATALSFSADGKRLAATKFGNTLEVWNVDTGASILPAVALVPSNANELASIIRGTLTPDGKSFVTNSFGNDVNVFDAGTGKLQRALKGHTQPVGVVATSPDGKWVASASDDLSVKLWDFASGTTKSTLIGHEVSVETLAFSDDGLQLATADGAGVIKIWDVASGAIKKSLLDTHLVRSVVFSSGGAQLFVGDANEIVVYDIASEKPIRTSGGYIGVPYNLTLAQGGATLLYNDDANIVIWRNWRDIAKAQKQTLEGQSSTVQSMALSKDAIKLAAVTSSAEALLWDLNANPSTAAQLDGIQDGAIGVTFSADGARIIALTLQEIKSWDAKTRAPLSSVKTPYANISAVAFSPTANEAIVTTDGNNAYAIDLTTGKELRKYATTDDVLVSVTYRADGKQIVAGGSSGMTYVWNTEASQPTHKLGTRNESTIVLCVASNADGSLVASGDTNGKIILWDAKSGKAIRAIEAHTNDVVDVEFTPDGATLISSGADGSIRLWETK
jgi:WD40 repeat protein